MRQSNVIVDLSSNLSASPAWKRLETHYLSAKYLQMKELFAHDPDRFSKHSIHFEDLLFDYSKNRFTEETLNHLFALARQCNIHKWQERMFSGEKINTTEGRAVLHTALRNRSNTAIYVDGKDVMPMIQSVLDKMKIFSKKVRKGEWKGYTGKEITDVVNIGIGGSDLGPKMICRALSQYQHPRLKIHFLSNVDSAHAERILNQLDSETTLFIVASKTFTTQETRRNAQTAKEWLLNCGAEKQDIAKHFVAVSTNTAEVTKFGIDPNNMFEFWDWVGGRYSLWSAIGLTIVLAIGMPQFIELLEGAHAMDQHFKNMPLEKNIPVIMGLLGIWYNNFFGAESSAVLPYDYYLRELPAYLEQADMESNGKSVDRDGERIDYSTGSIVWGAEGNNGQHAFYQLIHQGTKLIPTDFIIASSTHTGCNQEHRNILVSNFLAQTEALMIGRSRSETREQLASAGVQIKGIEQKIPHMVFDGNQPSNSILLKELTPRTLGSLIAMYEHKIFVQGIIWNLNSYDQWGVELGKHLTEKVLEELQLQKDIYHHDSSTRGLLHQFRNYYTQTARERETKK
jgi:glucose-6-phosphate isomerase